MTDFDPLKAVAILSALPWAVTKRRKATRWQVGAVVEQWVVDVREDLQEFLGGRPLLCPAQPVVQALMLGTTRRGGSCLLARLWRGRARFISERIL